MNAWQRVLAEIRGNRTETEWAAELGIANRQNVNNWFREENPYRPNGIHLVLILQAATDDQRERLLAALRDSRDLVVK